MKRRIAMGLLIAIALPLLFISCNSEVAEFDVSEHYSAFAVSFKRGNDGNGKALSVGSGSVEFPFETMDSHKIKLKSVTGLGNCSLAGAKDGFVTWPEESITMSFGEWIIYAESYKNGTKYYDNGNGLSFIVSAQGVSLDGGQTWGTSVYVEEMFVSSASATIKTNSGLKILDESGLEINLAVEPYSSFEIRWFLTKTEQPANLLLANFVTDLTESGTDFVEWKDSEQALSAEGYTFAMAAITSRSEEDSIIYGSAIAMLDNLSSGNVYVIGSGENDFIQFGKNAVWFDKPHEHAYIETGRVEPSCLSDGYVDFACSICGAGYREVISHNGHKWSGWTVSGSTASHTCSVCGKEESVEIPESGAKPFDISEYATAEDEAANRNCSTYYYDENGNYLFRREYKYNSEGNKIERITFDESGMLADKTEYDGASIRGGKTTKRIVYNKDNSIRYYEIFNYENDGFTDRYRYNSSDVLEYRFEDHYNTSGYLAKTVLFSADKSIKIREWIYEGVANNNRTVTCITFAADGSVYTLEELSYDSELRSESRYYRVDGSERLLESIIENEYNLSGYTVKSISKNASGIVETIEYRKGSFSNYITRREEYNSNGEISCYYANYDTGYDGNKTRSFRYDAEDNLLGSWVSEFDSWGWTIKEISYDSNGVKTDLNERASGVTTDRRQRKWTGYNPDGTVRQYEIYEYDANGNRTSYQYNAEGVLLYKNVSVFNGYGYRISQTQYSADDIIIRIRTFSGTQSNGAETGCVYYENGKISYVLKDYTYYDDGNVKSYNMYDSDDIFVYSFEVKYNSRGYRTKEIKYDSAGNLFDVRVYPGTSSHNSVTEVIRYNSDGKTIRFINKDFIYDSNGNTLSLIQCNADGSIRYTFAHDYNASGYMTQENCYYPDGSLCSVVYFSGSRDNYVIKEVGYEQDGSVSYYFENYEYDQNGNYKGYDRFDGNHVLDWHSTYEYNDNGYRTKETRIYKDGEKRVWIYDGTSNQRQIESYSYLTADASGDEWEWKSTFEYNVYGYRTKEIRLYKDGEKRVWIYDGTSNQRQIESYYYQTENAPEDNWEWYEEYSYNDQGNRVYSIQYVRENGETRVSRERWWNGSSQWLVIRSKWYNSDGSYGVSEYNSEGRVVKETYYKTADASGDEWEWKSTFEYNNNGHRIKETMLTKVGTKFVSIYDGTSNENQIEDYYYESVDASEEDWVSRCITEYDAYGYITKQTRIFKAGLIDVLIYDGTSKQLLTKSYSYENADAAEDAWESETTYEYNDNGYRTRETQIDKDGRKYVRIYDGTSKQLLTKSYSYENADAAEDEWQWQRSFDYNNNGYRIREIQINKDGSKNIWIYDGLSDQLNCIAYEQYGSDGQLINRIDYT